MEVSDKIGVENQEGNKKSRVVYLDYVRVLATLAVVFIHITSLRWWEADVNGFEFRIYNFYNGISRWGVDAFILVSGALILAKNISIKKIYTKNIFRMAIAYIFWCLFYYFFNGESFIIQYRSLWEDNTFYSIAEIFKGYYHMWFIPMIIGLYICSPILRIICENQRIKTYFLAVTVIVLYIRGMLVQASFLVDIPKLSYIVETMENTIASMNLDLFMGYSSIFVLGYVIANYELKKRWRYLIYVFGMIGLIATVEFSRLISIKYQIPNEMFHINMAWNTVVVSVAVMTFFKYIKLQNAAINSVFRFMSKYCFGVYLSHVFIIEKLAKYVMVMVIKPIVLIPVVTVIVFFIAFVVSYILNHIPVVKKYIV